MKDEEITLIFNSIDLIREELYKAKIEPQFSDEINERKKRNPAKIKDDNDVLRRFAILIAYSQNAPSNLVSEMLDKGIFDEIFHNFEISEVAEMDPDIIISHFWDKIKVIRYKKKIASIIDCAKSLVSIKSKYGSFAVLLRDMPVNLKSNEDIEKFWEEFEKLKTKLERENMPFFKQPTSLLHFLLNIGYDCIKPDLVVMKVAKDLGIASLGSEKEKLKVVRFLQQYSISRKIKTSIVDFYLLVYGGQLWARQFVHKTFYDNKKIII